MGCAQPDSIFCCGLSSAVLAIGITRLVLDILGGLFMAGVLANTHLVREVVADDPSLLEDDQPVEEQIEHMVRSVQILFGLGLAAMLVGAVLDIGLLMARSRRWRGPLLAWIIGRGIITAGVIGFGMYLAVLVVTTSESSSEVWFYIGCHLADGGFCIYFIMGVQSYYRRVVQMDNDRRYTMQQLTEDA